jgi:hypothetical protein
MADKDQSKIRYDDFIGKVQSDPANPQATIMLAGFTGQGADGHVRIYPDPTLGNWYDVPEADVLHSQPIGNSDLGGSYVWVKGSAQIKPGSALNPQPLPPAPQQPLLQPTPATHCFICPPQTQVWVCQQQTHLLNCPTAPVVCDTMPQTHQLHCPTAPVVCDTIVRTNLPQCGVFAPTAACGGQQQGQPQAMAQAFQPTPSAVQHCGGMTTINMCAPPPQPFSQHICPTPSAVHQCGGQPQPFSQHICPTPSAVHQCGGQPQPFSQHICPTPSAVHQCGGQPQPFSQHICPTPSAVHQCGQPFSQHICPTPSAVQQCGISQHVICATPTVTANIACLQTANTPCLPITLAGCTPQSIACTPNGTFNPFGR